MKQGDHVRKGRYGVHVIKSSSVGGRFADSLCGKRFDLEAKDVVVDEPSACEVCVGLDPRTQADLR